MKRCKLFHVVVATLVSVGMLAPQSAALAAGPSSAATSSSRDVGQQVVDVALGTGGTLQGQLVSVNGVPKANAKVVVRRGDTVVAVTQTDERGYFVVQGLRGGTYEITAQGASSLYRLWAPNTAPPTAQGGALLVEAGDVIRGNLLSHLGTGNGLGLAALIGGGILIGGLVEKNGS